MKNIKDKKVSIADVSLGLGHALAEKILDRGGYILKDL